MSSIPVQKIRDLESNQNILWSLIYLYPNHNSNLLEEKFKFQKDKSKEIKAELIFRIVVRQLCLDYSNESNNYVINMTSARLWKKLNTVHDRYRTCARILNARL
ncbi:hypothetical protein Glove_23g55 [Diversispora epigaea]|uniref:Uncharacterized protein n=1 Tax=Diversispora epigaea TaxID=1348612 RepID=A0A397JK19_9GLOM|nr:hypothetical protein Glove_23g55 [Diversispora epigaea]